MGHGYIRDGVGRWGLLTGFDVLFIWALLGTDLVGVAAPGEIFMKVLDLGCSWVQRIEGWRY